MASWFELFLNIIGYGGFIVMASSHRPQTVDDAAGDVGRDG